MDSVVRNWWAQAVRGGEALLLLATCAGWPSIPADAMRWLFASYLLVSGLVALPAALLHRRRGMPPWPTVLDGTWDLAFVPAMMLNPMPAPMLAYAIAWWAIGDGILELWAATRLRREIGGELALGSVGVTSLIFGMVLGGITRAGVDGLAVAVAIFGLFSTAAYVKLAVELHDRASKPPRAAGA
jgi:uncharacterized membrane protein HdeD (DUF308 family)